jgi:hypothetical protein
MEYKRGDKYYCVKSCLNGAIKGRWYVIGATYAWRKSGKLSEFALESEDYDYDERRGFRVKISALENTLKFFHEHFISEKEYNRENKISNLLNED